MADVEIRPVLPSCCGLVPAGFFQHNEKPEWCDVIGPKKRLRLSHVRNRFIATPLGEFL